jgi:hypothetical protein
MTSLKMQFLRNIFSLLSIAAVSLHHRIHATKGTAVINPLKKELG